MFNLTERQDSFSKQVPKNLIANALYFLLSSLIGLFLVPFYINSIGVASYAIIPLVTSLTSYVNLIVQSLNTSASRYLTIDLQRREFKKANITFNTTLFGVLGIILLMLPLVLGISYYAPSFFEIPENQNEATRILFIGVISAFLVQALSSNFGVSLFAYNRLDLQNLINVINILIQVGLTIFLFNLFSPSLIYIGIAYLIGATAASVATIYFSHKINPYLKVNIRDFQKSKVKEITEMGSWVIINQIGTLLFIQIDLIVVTKLFGTLVAGEYSIVLTWSILLRSIAGMLVGVLTPVVLTYYAKDRIDEMVNLSKSAVKLTGYTMALPIGYICGFAPQLLSLWIGPEYAKLSPLVLLMLSHLIINLPVMPLFAINVAYNKVRVPGVVTLLMGIGNLLLALMLPLLIGWSYYGVATAGAIMLTLKNACFIPWYATKVLGVSKTEFISPTFSGVLPMIMVLGMSYLMRDFFQTSGFLDLAACAIIVIVIYLPVVWTFGLNQSEREILKSIETFKVRNKLHFETKFSR